MSPLPSAFARSPRFHLNPRLSATFYTETRAGQRDLHATAGPVFGRSGQPDEPPYCRRFERGIARTSSFGGREGRLEVEPRRPLARLAPASMNRDACPRERREPRQGQGRWRATRSLRPQGGRPCDRRLDRRPALAVDHSPCVDKNEGGIAAKHRASEGETTVGSLTRGSRLHT
jgi:hypothetical protein